MSNRSDGSTASYYQLPPGCTELQDLISYRNMNAQDGEVFRAIYRKGRASHSDELRDARKVLFYAQAEVIRLESMRAAPEQFGQKNMLDFDESRADAIGQNGNEGEHYAEFRYEGLKEEAIKSGSRGIGECDWCKEHFSSCTGGCYLGVAGGSHEK